MEEPKVISSAYEEIEPGMFVLKGSEPYPEGPYVYTVKLVSKMKQWSFNPDQESPKAIMCEDDVVMYIDDVPEEIAAKVVELHNEGKSIEDIGEYLANDNGCFTDSREFIMENITNFQKLSEVENNQNLTPGAAGSAPHGPQGIQGPEKPLSQQQRAAITRKANAAKKLEQQGGNGGKTTVPKKASTKDAIRDLEDKIALLKVLDAAPSLEIPLGIGKAGREIMIEFQKEQDAVVQKYIGRIQKM
jgi:hypothetical protein